MKNLFLILSLLFISQANSQDLISTQTYIKSGLVYAFDRSDKSIQGNPYLDEDFSPAYVSADENKIFNIRYNLVSDDMEIENERKEINALIKTILNLKVTFIKDNKTYQLLNYLNENGSSVNGFFNVLSDIDGKVKILVKESKTYKKRQEARSSYQDAIPASFKKARDKYFIKVGDENALLLPKNKKDVAKLFPDFESQIASFIKKNKIKTSSTDDLIDLGNYINSLDI